MRKAILPILITALVLLGISFYLHSIDHPKTTIVTKPPYTVTNTSVQVLFPIFAGNITETSHIPPPQYASLWPETLNAGIVLLLILVFLLWRNSKYQK